MHIHSFSTDSRAGNPSHNSIALSMHLSYKTIMQRDSILSVRLPAELKAELERLSEIEGISMSACTVRLIRKHIAAEMLAARRTQKPTIKQSS